MTLKDKDIREPLFFFLEEQYGKVRFIEEKNVGRSRADVLMVTETELIGVEIKSDADSYARLSSQIKDYDRFCDRNYVAVGSRHAAHIMEHVPEHWGIITIDEVDGEADFYVLRQSQLNPKMKPEDKIKLLWRRELAHIQEINNLPKYKEKSKLFVEMKILEKVDAAVLWPQFYEELFERDYMTIAAEIRAYRQERRGTQRGARRRRRR